MIRVILSADGTDKCDAFTLLGIVRGALLGNDRFRSFAEFRNIPELQIVLLTGDGFHIDPTPNIGNAVS